MSTLTKTDFETDAEVRWCPGCGDYAVLASMQKMLPELGIAKEDMVFISGIGCSSRFPYYVDTYGFHTIHGRAPTVATGLKLMRPELSVWVVTGDGDGLSIGAGHLLHLMRRNVDLTVMLFNNRIYGLTKGQYSPTSEQGKVTKTSPEGSVDMPLHPLSVALSANCSFVARAIDVDAPRLQTVLKAAAEHPGTSFVEIYQNCNVFNDGAFSSFAERPVRAQRTVTVMAGEPLRFGQHNDQYLCWTGEKWVIEHNCTDPFIWPENPTEGMLHSLVKLPAEDFPVPVGIFCATKRPCYEAQQPATQKPALSLDALLREGDTWVVD